MTLRGSALCPWQRSPRGSPGGHCSLALRHLTLISGAALAATACPRSDGAGLAGERLARRLQQVALAEAVPGIGVLALQAWLQVRHLITLRA